MNPRTFLIRFGHAGRIDWFGTVHQFAVARNAHVVVQNHEGRWLGQVLTLPDPNQAPTSPGEQPPNSSTKPRGELLHVANPEDHRVAQLAQQTARELHAQASRALAASHSSEATPLLTILDAEVTLDQRCGVLHFLGQPHPQLGRLASQLAVATGLERVQWLPHRSQLAPADQLVPPRTLPASDSNSPRSTESREPPSLAAPAKNAQPSPADHAAFRKLHALLWNDATPEQLRLARRQRDNLGMLGVYSQREKPAANASEKRNSTEKHASTDNWMVRVKTTGGALTHGQLARLVELSEQRGDGTLRLTMRQGLQFHGVHWGEVGELLAQLEDTMLYARGSCGNAMRNVTCCPLEPQTEEARAVRRLATRLANQGMPTTDWLEYVLEPPVESASREPDLADAVASLQTMPTLPHKWKIGIATAQDNCINVLNNDVALVVSKAQLDPATLAKTTSSLVVHCHVGGSTAFRSGPPRSRGPERTPELASALCTVPYEACEQLITRLVEWFRRHGKQGTRPARRFKTVLKRTGLDALRDWLDTTDLPHTSDTPPACSQPWQLHQGWHAEHDGSWTLALPIPGGRLGQRSSAATSSAATEIPNTYSLTPGPTRARDWLALTKHARWLRVGPGHTLILGGVPAAARETIETWIANQQLSVPAAISVPAAHSPLESKTLTPTLPICNAPRVLTCVARPSCPFAQSEAESAFPRWQAFAPRIQSSLRRLGLLPEPHAGEPLLAVAACENGCSQPLSVPCGVIGRRADRFDVYLGGSATRIGKRVLRAAGPEDLVDQLEWLAERFENANSASNASAESPDTRPPPLDRAVSRLESELGKLNFPWPVPND